MGGIGSEDAIGEFGAAVWGGQSPPHMSPGIKFAKHSNFRMQKAIIGMWSRSFIYVLPAIGFMLSQWGEKGDRTIMPYQTKLSTLWPSAHRVVSLLLLMQDEFSYQLRIDNRSDVRKKKGQGLRH